MTEEMLGGEQQNDESDTDLSVRGEHTKHERSMLFSRYATGVSQGGQHPRKKLLQRPASLEIPDLPGVVGRFHLTLQRGECIYFVSLSLNPYDSSTSCRRTTPSNSWTFARLTTGNKSVFTAPIRASTKSKGWSECTCGNSASCNKSPTFLVLAASEPNSCNSSRVSTPITP